MDDDDDYDYNNNDDDNEVWQNGRSNDLWVVETPFLSFKLSSLHTTLIC